MKHAQKAKSTTPFLRSVCLDLPPRKIDGSVPKRRKSLNSDILGKKVPFWKKISTQNG